MKASILPQDPPTFSRSAGALSLPFEQRRAELLDISRDYLDNRMEQLRVLTEQGHSGTVIVKELSSVFDRLITSLFHATVADLDENQVAGCAVIALGGYGRAEMNPRSDLDLMFFYETSGKEAAKIISDRMLYLLWDLSLDVGYSVRSAKDCLEQAGQDDTVRTALLDARLLCGNPVVFSTFTQKVGKYVLNSNTSAFIRLKQVEIEERRKKYGSSVYLLEPNLKEGEGGLRDLHAAIWLARVKFKAADLNELLIRGILTEPQAEEFRQAFDYLWRLRNHLHFLGQRKSDQLSFELQQQLAKVLGFKDGREESAVEKFMQEYYTHAAHVEQLSTGLILKATERDTTPSTITGFFVRRNLEDGFNIVRGEIFVSDPEIFQRDPALMMKAFELAQRHEAKLSLALKTLIRESLPLINDKVRRSRRINTWFLNILNHHKGVGKTLRDMHHLHFLNAFIPEFKKIFRRVQFDLYHIYTVDFHSLFAVEEICRLWAGEHSESQPFLTKVADNIEKRSLLLLSVLFHDIGKGHGSDHSSRGAALIPTIARRMGLNREDSQRLEFLVQHHLKMAHISQRRDLTDLKMIVQFAELMGMSENLRMLYLLTYADLRAVGPDVWTEWKGQLLQELFELTYDLLEKGNFYQEKRSEKVRNRKRKVREALLDEFPEHRVAKGINSLNTRYLLSYRSKEIIPHLRLALGRGKKTLAMQIEQKRDAGYTELTLATIDSPGLFSTITGVLSAHSINILGAQIHTRKTGAVLDILQVNSPIGDVVDNPAKWKRVENDLTAAIEGRIRVEDLIKKRQEPAYLKTKEKPKRPNVVEFDNQISDEYTVIDIFANDKVGLLYDITHALKELGLYIAVSKISTKVDQAADVFYVRDIFGQKITDQEKIEKIRATLLAQLDH